MPLQKRSTRDGRRWITYRDEHQIRDRLVRRHFRGRSTRAQVRVRSSSSDHRGDRAGKGEWKKPVTKGIPKEEADYQH